MTEPTLSVVIASWPDLDGLPECLDALAPQQGEAAEVFVVSPACPTPELKERHPWVRWLAAPADRLIPHLWGQGMVQAVGDVMAITTAHFAPAADWLAALRQAHVRLDAPAIGGRIEPPRGGRLVDWATFFLRYSQYHGLDREQELGDLAGDNASYKRAALAAYPGELAEGFWELDLHRRLRAAGQRLMFVPAVRVTQRTSFGFRRFLAQRLHHGRQFGRSRFAGRSGLLRVATAAAAPLIPLVFLARITGRVARGRRDYGPFLAALPILVCFLIAWSLGEAWGYLSRFRTVRQNASEPEA